MGVTSIASIPDEILEITSREAILEAQPLFTFKNFVEVKTQLGLERGATINFLKLNNIGGGGFLNEFDPVPRQTIKESIVPITVREMANGVTVTNYANVSSFRDLLADASTLLGRNYADTLDSMLRDVYLTTNNKQYAGGASNDGGIAGTALLNTDEIKDAVEALKTLNVPGIRRGADDVYVCIAHPHQMRSIRDDADWKNVHSYSAPSEIFRGEVGMYEGVVFIETTKMPVSAGVGQGGIDVYSSVIFGDRAVGYAETVPMEVRDNGNQDFRRFLSLAWYTICGAGIVNDYIIEVRTA